MLKPISITTTANDEFMQLSVNCDSDLSPQELLGMTTPRINTKKGLVIMNHLEPLLIAYLVSIYRNAAWIAVGYGRGDCYMVVNGSKTEIKLGDVFEFNYLEDGSVTVNWLGRKY